MKINFKKELESASRGMIMIHDPRLLIKLIVRMIVRKLGIKHAGMILFDPELNAYVLSISRGETGIKIPSGFTKFNDESPIIRFFKKQEFKPLRIDKNAIISNDINRMIWRESVIENGNSSKELLHKVGEQMQMLNATACVPAYYQDKLMAILLLGDKYDGIPFEQDELDFFAALASDAAMAIRNAQLFKGLKKEADKNRKLFIQTIIVLASTIEAKDAYTKGHSEYVTKYSLAIARQIQSNGAADINEGFLESLYIGSLLHDIGKIGIPEAILNKKGGLTEEEYSLMKNHPLRGMEIVRPLSFSKECIDGIKYHHERVDGKGYPEGLKGEEIPLSASIIAVADTFHAMISDRPYRKALSKEAAVLEIKNNIGKQFLPIPANALIELYNMGAV